MEFYIEIATGFAVGAALIVLSFYIFKLPVKGLYRFLLNALLGCVLLVCLNLFGIGVLPLNPLNALVTGYLGVFGVAFLFAVTRVF
ncbi:MAG: pro-sigmaK processing inhibitor BofA family protein [Firmicutes bacterium]|nr:pro-sigmaK processing inhibitor BofA family protein [Bacillota bacterium]